MLLVNTYVAPSAIHGLGVFAGETIPKGTAIWRFDERIDRVLTAAEVQLLPPAKQLVEIYAEFLPGEEIFILSGDNDRFTNHSANPNTDVSRPNTVKSIMFSIRDISSGEEITCDYADINMIRYGWDS